MLFYLTNSIGLTAQLLPVPPNSLNAFYNNPVCDSSNYPPLSPLTPINKQIQMVSPLDPSKTSGTPLFCIFYFLLYYCIASKQQPFPKDQMRRGLHTSNDLQYRSII